MADVARRWWPLALIALAAFWLRTHELDRRPMHWDEANQAVKAGELVEKGRYVFDPADHHGPTLYYAVLPIAWLRGERTLAELSETSVRLVPAIFGTAGVILVAMLAIGPRRPLAGTRADVTPAANGREPRVAWAAIAAAAFVAVSPTAVYYSRYFIQETLLVTFTLGALVSGQHWWRSGRAGWAIALGACAGLMQATKASAPLFLMAGLVAAAVTIRFHRSGGGPPAASPADGRRCWWRDAGLAFGTALLVAALFYASFGTNLRGLLDAARVYEFAQERIGGNGHEKPWWYYLQLFGWMRSGGLVWHQLAFSVLAIAGLAIGVTSLLRARRTSANAAATGTVATESRRADRRGTLAIWAGVYTVVIMGAFSAIAYKTPWHAVHFVPGMALLGACALRAVSRLNTGKFVAVAIAWVTIGTLYQQTARAVFLRPADARNPYAYVHSSADVLKFRAIAETALAQAPGKPIHIVSEEYWPLPWYLRGLQVGYWSEIPPDVDGALVIASQSTAEAVAARLRGNYRQTFLGLRPGFVCILFIREP